MLLRYTCSSNAYQQKVGSWIPILSETRGRSIFYLSNLYTISSLNYFFKKYIRMHRRTLNSDTKISLETFEDAESVIRNSKSKKDRQHNGQRKRVKTSNG